MKILIGYDGSESSDTMLDDLKLAGLPRDSEVLVMSVADLLMGGPKLTDAAQEIVVPRRVAASLERARTHGEQVVKEAESFAAQGAEKLRTEFPGWNITFDVTSGPPAWELIDAADNWGADLLIVGSHGRSAIGRLFLGSVSKKVVTDSHCSARVARPRAPENNNSLPRIIVGVDGSLAVEQAVYAVGQRVWPLGTEVQLVAVDDTTPPAGIAARLPQAARMIGSYLQKKEDRVHEMLDWATAELGAIGLNTSVSVVKGDPKSVLITHARETNADCIFVGTRDFKSGFERLRLGSVSTAVVTNAHCSVEVVRFTQLVQ